MMRKFFTVLVVAVIVAVMAAPVFATGASKESGEQLGRGSKNLLLGWTDIPKTIVDTSKNENALVGVTVGTIKGICNAVARTISGAVDVVTFPAGNDKPAIQPNMVSGPESAPASTGTSK